MNKLINKEGITSERVSAYKARTNFGEIMNEVHYKGGEFVVERRGKPMVKIFPAKVTEEAKKKFLSFAGILTDEDAKIMKKVIAETRKDSGRKIKNL